MTIKMSINQPYKILTCYRLAIDILKKILLKPSAYQTKFHHFVSGIQYQDYKFYLFLHYYKNV